jgi:GNAT superfamily N-acetyltransferase
MPRLRTWQASASTTIFEQATDLRQHMTPHSVAVEIRIRDARPSDRDPVLALVPRLRSFGPGELRPASDLDRAESEVLARVITSLPEGARLLVAEAEGAEPAVVGVAYAETATDYFTREQHAHLAILSVAQAVEGQGVGRALLDAVEAWARALGRRFITLNVFADNDRARHVYERAGYAPDTIRYAKVLGAS